MSVLITVESLDSTVMWVEIVDPVVCGWFRQRGELFSVVFVLGNDWQVG